MSRTKFNSLVFFICRNVIILFRVIKIFHSGRRFPLWLISLKIYQIQKDGLVLT